MKVILERNILIRDMIIALILFANLGFSQSVLELSDYNYLSSPKKTEVIFSFDTVFANPVSIGITQHHSLDFTARIDTFLKPGESNCIINLYAEGPGIIQIEVDSIIDHILVVPGVNSKIIFPSKINGTHINEYDVHNNIEKYFKKKLELLGAKIDVTEAFQFLRNYPDLEQAERILDSISRIQVDLLTDHRSIIPYWFLLYEKKNIENTSLLYKLLVANNLIKEGILASESELVIRIIEEVDYKDHVGPMVPSYLQNLSLAAILKYCESDCFGLEDSGLINIHSAILKYLQELKNEAIRNALAAQNLLLIYNSSRSLPDTIILEFESNLSDPKYRQRIDKHKNPFLNGRDAPNFYLKNNSEVFQSLNDFKGKVVLLNFWFVGCRPCEEEIPYEKKLIQTLKELPFVLLNVCMRSGEKAWRDLIMREEMPGVHLYANENWTNKVSKNYNIEGYPRYVLVGKNGKVITGRSPRPSNSTLLSLIEEHLQN